MKLLLNRQILSRKSEFDQRTDHTLAQIRIRSTNGSYMERRTRSTNGSYCECCNPVLRSVAEPRRAADPTASSSPTPSGAVQTALKHNPKSTAAVRTRAIVSRRLKLQFVSQQQPCQEREYNEKGKTSSYYPRSFSRIATQINQDYPSPFLRR